jgi:chromosome segregation ATPase
VERVRKRTREYPRLLQRVEQLQRQFLDANKEHYALKADHGALQWEHDALEAQHAALKSDCTNLESQRNKTQRKYTELQKEYETVTCDAQQWKESCKKARADILAVRKEKATQDEAMAELAEREREFRHRAHANKMAVSVHSFPEALSIIFPLH